MKYNNFIGYLTFPSGKVLVSDPCYVKKGGKQIDENETGKSSVSFWTLEVKESEHWQATAVLHNESGWGMRVMKLRVAVSGWDDFDRNCSGVWSRPVKMKVATVHNDAGMIMIADREALSGWGEDEYVEPLSAFAGQLNYSGACYAANDFAGLIGASKHSLPISVAVVSSSGYGDGQYEVFVWLDYDNDIVAIEVNYEDEDEDEEDEDDEEEEEN